MDLSEILSKTKGRSEKIKIIRKPPSIASIDRPYSPADISETNKNSSSIQTKTDNKPATNWQQTDNRSDNKLATNR